jgi:polysaccharide chain length determinant protein (PEP-CTERM system associated)
VIPGKQYKPEDILEAAWRRRWYIVLPFVIISAVSVLLAELLPDRYRSEALLQVIAQQVPSDYVKSTVTQRLDSRVNAMAQSILSRTKLEQIVQDFNLYPRERRRLIMEDVIERMRNHDILIGGRGGRIDGNAFSVGFEAGDPKTAMLVAERLGALFIQENLQERSVVADQTDQFLHSQLDDTRRQLKDYEKRLEDFRHANPGRMPAEVQTNQQQLTATQAQLTALQDSINRDRDRQLTVQQLLADLTNAATPLPAADGSTPAQPLSAAKQLEIARVVLRNMETRGFTPDHPDVKIQKRLIRDLEQKAAVESLQQPVSPLTGDAAKSSRAEDLQAELTMLQHRIETKQNTEKSLFAAITQYRQRLEAVPTVETQLTELMRDYNTLQTTYQSLLTRSQEARIASHMEQRQIGEQFRIIDAARLPQKPASPNRMQLIALGCFGGLGLGFAVALLLEYRDKSLRSEEDVVFALALPVLALVPTMLSKEQRRRMQRNKILIAASAAAAFVCSAVIVVWKFETITGWIR